MFKRKRCSSEHLVEKLIPDGKSVKIVECYRQRDGITIKKRTASRVTGMKMDGKASEIG